jgi:hypothetical protein
MKAFRFAPQPNKSFNADANTGHGFAILLASVGALRPYGLRRRLTQALGSFQTTLIDSRRASNQEPFMSVISRLFAWLLTGRKLPKTSAMCCSSQKLRAEKDDLGHAASFEFMHTTCQNCGAHWLEVFCVANGVSGLEPVTPAVAATMLATSPGVERKAFMNAWASENL